MAESASRSYMTALNKRHSDMARARIRVSNILTYLQKHVRGEVEMSATQVRAAEILLNKALANAPTKVEQSGPDGKPQENIHKVVFGD